MAEGLQRDVRSARSQVEKDRGGPPSIRITRELDHPFVDEDVCKRRVPAARRSHNISTQWDAVVVRTVRERCIDRTCYRELSERAP
jgi:hypothetical protein